MDLCTNVVPHVSRHSVDVPSYLFTRSVTQSVPVGLVLIIVLMIPSWSQLSVDSFRQCL